MTPNTETPEMVACLPLTAKERDLLLFGMARLIDTTTEHAEPAEAMFAKIEEAPTLDAAEQRASSDVKVKELEDCLRDILRGEYEAKHRYGLTDCIDNRGKAYQSQYLADCLKRAEELLGVDALQNGGGDA